MHFAKITRFQRLVTPSFYNCQNINKNLMDFWAGALFNPTTPDYIGKRVAGPYIYTKSFAMGSYDCELRDAANSLSYFQRHFSIHGFVPERQVYSSSDTMLVRTYISERPNNMLSALFFMERLSDRAGEAHAAEYYNILNNVKFIPTDKQWGDLPQINSWIQHVFPQPHKGNYNFGMTPEYK